MFSCCSNNKNEGGAHGEEISIGLRAGPKVAKSGGLTPETLGEAHELFDHFDVGRKGYLTLDELANLLASTKSGAPPNDRVVKNFVHTLLPEKSAQIEKSGGITFEDLKTMLDRLELDEGYVDDRIVSAFISAALPMEGNLTTEQVHKLLEVLCIDTPDGELTEYMSHHEISLRSLEAAVQKKLEEMKDTEHSHHTTDAHDHASTDLLGHIAHQLINIAKLRHQEVISIRSVLTEEERDPVHFVPKKHLAYKKPSECFTMSDLGLKRDHLTVADFACTRPFPLLSKEGCETLKKEIFKEQVQKNCVFKSFKRAPYVVRGMGFYSKFTMDLWRSPEMEAIIQDATGLPLIVHPMDYEIAHVNIQEEGDKNAAEAWHCDSLPFVLVLMLTECEDMKGGETVLMDGRGQHVTVNYEHMGECVILHGQSVRHTVRRAENMGRITMVQAMILDDDRAPDFSNLFINLQYAVPEELYREWLLYRYDRLRRRLEHRVKELHQLGHGGIVDLEQASADINLIIQNLTETKEGLMANEQTFKKWMQDGSLRNRKNSNVKMASPAKASAWLSHLGPRKEE